MTNSIYPQDINAVIYVKEPLPIDFEEAVNKQCTKVDIVSSLPSFDAIKDIDKSLLYFVDLDICGTEIQQLALFKQLNAPIIFVNFQQSSCFVDTESEYCCLDWQTEPDSLLVKIPLAIFKRSFINHNSSETSLLTRAISCVGDILIYLDEDGCFLKSNHPLTKVASNKKLIGKRFDQIIHVQRRPLKEPFLQIVEAAIYRAAVTKLQPMSMSFHEGEYSLFDGLVGPIEYPSGHKGSVLILRKIENLAEVNDVFALNNEQHQPLEINQTRCVLLINPDDFKNINDKYGWQSGDEILEEVESRLNKVLRVADISTRYIGAFFLVLLNDTNDLQTYNLINQLKAELSEKKYLNEQAQLNFSFGFAINDQENKISLIELFYCANTALSKAIEFGGNQSIQWQQPSTIQQIGNFDRINGDFLSDGLVNYRKILTLWEQLNTIKIEGSKHQFIEQLNQKLLHGLELVSTRFFSMERHELHFIHGMNNQDEQLGRPQHLQVDEQAFIEGFLVKGNEGQPFFSSMSDDNLRLVLPVIENDKLLAVIILTSDDQELATVRNQNLLTKLADYIRVSLQKIEFIDKTKNESFLSIEPASNSRFWYNSKVMETLMTEVNMVAKTDATVLINGESGTGKEFLARTIHDLSNRQIKPFVIFDCSTIVENLLESELFGHSKGAFTGADKMSQGCISQAEGGTLFLDEIGELSPETQMKLLRFIQEKQYSPVGSSQYYHADVRIISATNVNLKDHLDQGLFREDLYYRINVFNVSTPPLRARQDDVLLLANNFLSMFVKKYQKVITGFTKQAQVALTQYQWPGNVRELKNVIHKACILCQDYEIDCSHLGLHSEFSDELNGISTSNNQPAVMLESNHFKVGNVHKEVQIIESEPPMNTVQFLHLSPMLDEIVDELDQCNLFAVDNNIAFADLVENRLYKYALYRHSQVVLQAANKLHISESTLRRHLKNTYDSQTVFSNEHIDKIDVFVKGVYDKELSSSKPLLIRNLLVKCCLNRGFKANKTARIIGVSNVTLRKIIKNIA